MPAAKPHDGIQDQYAERFKDTRVANAYDAELYGPYSWNTFIWSLNRKRLLKLAEGLASRGPIRYLDFATGTGRILNVVAPLARDAIGVDVSGAMVEVARQRTPGAEFIVGDIFATPELLSDPFDLITIFRFFLNVEPESRLPVLRQLAKRLRDGHSRLVFDIHRNTHSLDGLLDRVLAPPSNQTTMSATQALGLIRGAGLELEESWGVGLMPSAERQLKGVAPAFRVIDRAAAKMRLARGVSRSLVFVCRLPTE